jgi:tetratricopeptide (TPR) repeat protein
MLIRVIGGIGVSAAVWALVGCGGGDGDEGPSLTQQYHEAMQIESPEGRATKLVGVATKQDAAGDSSGAERSLRDAVEAANQIEDAIGKATAFNDIAELQGQCRMLTEATTSVKKVRDAVEEIDDEQTKVALWSKMAVTYGLYLNKKSTAEVYLKKAEELVNKLTEPADKVTALLALAYNFQRMEMQEQADGMVEAAITTAKGIEEPRGRCNAIAEVASQLVKMGRQDDAVARFDEAIAEAESIEDALSQAYALAEIGHAMGQAGMGDKGAALLDKAAAVANEKVTDRSMQTVILEQIDRYRGQL